MNCTAIREGGGPCGNNEMCVSVDMETLSDHGATVGSFLSRYELQQDGLPG